LQKTNAHVDPRSISLDQAFRVRAARLARLLTIGPVAGHQDAEIEPLAVLDGRRAVRIEDVALVEDGVGDLFGQFEIHV
jgi:hypothetical protein